MLRPGSGAGQGEICDIDGQCVDAAEDEVFKLTTNRGKLAVEVEKVRALAYHPLTLLREAGSCNPGKSLGFGQFVLLSGARQPVMR